MSNTKKIKAGLVLQEPSEFIGQAGTLFYNEDTGSMFLSDGSTPGGIPLGQGGSGGISFSGNYNDLTNKPNLAAFANTTYVDDKATWANIADKPSFATVATSGSYDDLSNKPSIPSITGLATETFVNSALSSKVDSTSLALVATSGSYQDLEYLPTISTVGHTGNYNDLTNKPSIPSVVGLATENYVTSQGYVTSSSLNSTLGDYASKTYVGTQNFVTTSTLLAYGYLTASSLNSTLASYAQSSDLSAYATTTYVDDKATWANITGKPALFSGNYIDLTNKPTVPTDINQLTDTDGLLGQGGSGGTTDRLVNGEFEVVLGTDGNLTAGNINIGNLALISVEGGDVITSNNSADIDMFTNAGQDNYSEIWLHHGGNVEITTSGNTYSWNYTDTGNLVLPQSSAIPASTTSGIVFSDGTFEYTAATMGGASTGSITFADNSILGTGDVVIGFDLVASPAVNFSFTTSGVFIAPVIETGIVAIGGASLNTTDMVECLPDVDTVVYTSRDILTSTIKALFHVEGNEQGTSVIEAQSCEMMVARMSNRVSGSVYGLAYTSTLPLATFNARYNSQADIVEITCRPASTTDAVYVRTTATEMLTTP